MQVFAFFPEFPLAKGKFFLARLLHGLGATGMYLLLERLFPGPSQPVWAAAGSALEYGLTASTAAGDSPAADVPGLFGGAPAKAVKLPCPGLGLCYNGKHKVWQRGPGVRLLPMG